MKIPVALLISAIFLAPKFHIMSSSSCISVTSVFKVTESPSIFETDCISFVSAPNTPGEHEQVLSEIRLLLVHKA